MQIVVSSFRYADQGISEASVGYNWVKEVSKYNRVSLITTNSQNPKGGIEICPVKSEIALLNRYFATLNKAIKIDYFMFDIIAWFKYRYLVRNADIYHHLTPIAPRYHNSLSMVSKRFVLGPVGGGLRIPPKFRWLEKSEPIYAKLRNLDSFRLRNDPLLLGTYRKADVIILVGKYMLNIMPKEFHSKVKFLSEIGINIEDFPQDFQRSTSSEIRLLYVGRIVPYKGLELLIKAIGRIDADTRKKIKLQVVGNGSEYAEFCKKLTANLGLTDNILFCGQMTKNEVFDFFRKADIFCFPTLAETSGTVILEAMAMSLPVISINYGGPAEIVENSGGFLIKPIDPEFVICKLAEKITILVENSNLRLKMGVSARDTAIRKFSWKVKGVKMQKIYEEVVKKGNTETCNSRNAEPNRFDRTD